MKPRKRRGRPPVFVTGTDGKPVQGLSFNKSINQYYATYTKPREYFGSDYLNAIAKYRVWAMQQEQEPTTPITLEDVDSGVKLKKKFTAIKTPIIFTKSPLKIGETLKYKSSGGYKVTKEEVEIPESLQVIMAKKLFASKSLYELADLLEFPELRNVKRGSKPSVEPMPIGEVIEIYQARNIGKKEMGEVITAWNNFIDTIQVKYVEDIEETHIFKYRDWVKEQQILKNHKNDWVYKRYSRVKSVFKKVIPLTTRNTDSIRRVLEHCEKLILPRRNQGPNAQPISKEHFWKIYTSADVKWKALLLVSLNCGYYAKDIKDLKKEYIAIINGYSVIDFTRAKKDTKRINVLWEETIDAINIYFEEQPHNSKYVFVNKYRSPMTPGNVQEGFKKARKILNIPFEVKFNNIRDGAATALFGEVSEDLLNLVIGHEIKGEKKKYIGAKPGLMKQCADIIYKYYFPKI